MASLVSHSEASTVRELRSRVIHRPSSTLEVQALVQEARAKKTPLHPLSTGMNWGYGTALDLPGNVELVDLSTMSRILNAEEISRSNPVAVVEPGVTQGQLAEFLRLHHPDLMFNVTGSARNTSLIGNALDRGVGYLGPRRDDLFGLEVVTGAGTVVKTGFRRLGEESPLAHCHPFGLGPMLDGLFFQANFGIVTSACFKLLPRPPRQIAVSLALRNERDLPQFIETLAALKRERIMGTVTHIGNRARTRASLMHGIVNYLETRCSVRPEDVAREAEGVLEIVAPDQWTSLGGISGTHAQVRAAFAEVRSRLRGIARVMDIDDAKLDLGYKLLDAFRVIPWARANAAAISAIRPLHGLASGTPTDVAIDNLLWKFGRPDLSAKELDKTKCGILFISPALPMNGNFVARTVEKMSARAKDFGHQLFVTINIETENSMVAVTNLLFDRSDSVASANAKACANALHELIKSLKLEVYRARVDMMDKIVSPDSEYWKTVHGLKAALDPDHIISPGHYNIA
ncbi:hypothetical protein DBR47_13565 [Paucibacter sp. KBW04]|uniref:FAD-binding oxidoreductase n=1 Tax=Paucibacter sp. KBW04 TaxID=2153361 RepID=UPI000F56C44B|nr:FAD-binding oxidoreductase [Paucibacter sp. KBW04]RQO58708.1 hypothetical protein DBR47_13565 [Paucibacter sp. KBW04]